MLVLGFVSGNLVVDVVYVICVVVVIVGSSCLLGWLDWLLVLVLVLILVWCCSCRVFGWVVVGW